MWAERTDEEQNQRDPSQVESRPCRASGDREGRGRSPAPFWGAGSLLRDRISAGVRVNNSP